MMSCPAKCCELGSYECCVPIPVRGKVRGIDFCVADIVAALNAAGITTEASCCGHGEQLGTVILEDGRRILIARDCKHFECVAAALADGGRPMGTL